MKTSIKFKRYIKGNHLLKKEISFSTSGRKEWYLNGKRHREDGPAIEYNDGTKQWSLNGKRHREDGPAIEWKDGTKEWYLNGNIHREDGPAIEWNDGSKQWFLNGKRIFSEENYWIVIKKYK